MEDFVAKFLETVRILGVFVVAVFAMLLFVAWVLVNI